MYRVYPYPSYFSRIQIFKCALGARHRIEKSSCLTINIWIFRSGSQSSTSKKKKINLCFSNDFTASCIEFCIVFVVYDFSSFRFPDIGDYISNVKNTEWRLAAGQMRIEMVKASESRKLMEKKTENRQQHEQIMVQM